MKLNFIFSNLNVIVLGIWTLFLTIVTVRFFQPTWIKSKFNLLAKVIKYFKNIPFLRLLITAFVLNILYGVFVTWGQYHIWATATDFTKAFITLPLPKQVPMNSWMEWTRPLFAHSYGFFLFYVLGRVWLNIVILFLTSTAIYFILKFWKSYHGNFSQFGPELFFILMLTVGWPGVVILIPIGFIVALFFFAYYLFKNQNIVEIEPAFIIASIVVLFFGKMIFNLL